MIKYLKGIHHVGLPTNNMDGTIEFYKKLGGSIVFEKMDEEAGKPIRVVHIKLADLKIEVYERDEIAGVAGAFDHIAFQVNDIEAAFEFAKNLGLKFMENEINVSTYWPDGARWFIVYGVNGEKLEFTQSC